MKALFLLVCIISMSSLGMCQVASPDGTFLPKDSLVKDQSLVLKTYGSNVAHNRVIILGGPATAGFVGIGGISPTEMLHVNGNILSNATSTSRRIVGMDELDVPVIKSDKLESHAGKGFSFWTANAERFTIGSSGEVDISQNLTVRGLSLLLPSGNILLTSGNLQLNSGKVSAADMETKNLLVSGNADITQIRPTGKQVTIVDGNFTIAAGNQELTKGNLKLTDGNLFIKGKVGINTLDLSKADLTIHGKIAARDMQITTTTVRWPDYVFDVSNSPKTLAEVEEYIKLHGHLEGVPTAEEIEKDGYGVTQMNAILLKKIEELTLYIIEQQKQIDALRKRK